jgi:transcriptional regulator with XRE-family HTH domain
MNATGLAPSEQHLARVALGITIKNLRNRKNISQARLGARIFLSQPEVSKLERATDDARAIDEELLGKIARALRATKSEAETLKLQFDLMKLPIDSYRVIFAASAVEKQKKILAYEALTSSVTQFEHALIPGLLQVPDYMRAVIQAYGVSADEVEDVVIERLNRQRILSNSSRRFHFLLGRL